MRAHRCFSGFHKYAQEIFDEIAFPGGLSSEQEVYVELKNTSINIKIYKKSVTFLYFKNLLCYYI